MMQGANIKSTSELEVSYPKETKGNRPQVGDAFAVNGYIYVVRKKSFKGDLVCRCLGHLDDLSPEQEKQVAEQEITPVVDSTLPADVVLTQTPDTPGNDENGDGVTAGQTTADNHGDVLGL